VDAPFPRVTLFVPGVRAAARESFEADVECEWIENDGRFAAAFSFGTVGPHVIEKLEAAEGALVAYPTVDLRDGREQNGSSSSRPSRRKSGIEPPSPSFVRATNNSRAACTRSRYRTFT
jgi:hypothetical protein